jgi:hypothetical protein
VPKCSARASIERVAVFLSLRERIEVRAKFRTFANTWTCQSPVA